MHSGAQSDGISRGHQQGSSARVISRRHQQGSSGVIISARQCIELGVIRRHQRSSVHPIRARHQRSSVPLHAREQGVSEHHHVKRVVIAGGIKGQLPAQVVVRGVTGAL